MLILGAILLHLQPHDAQCRGDRHPLITVWINSPSLFSHQAIECLIPRQQSQQVAEVPRNRTPHSQVHGLQVPL